MHKKFAATVASLLFAVTVSGCLTAADSPTNPAALSEPRPVRPSYRGLNMSSCDGFLAMLPYPVDLLQPHVPSKYRIRWAGPATAYIVFQFDSCKHVALDGVDASPAKLLSVLIPVVPEGYSPNNLTFDPRYLVEFITDDEAVRQWFEQWTKASRLGSLAVAGTDLVGDDLRVDGTANQNGTLLYSWTAVVVKSTNLASGAARIYYGPDPRHDFWIIDSAYQRSAGDRAGYVHVFEGSGLGSIVQPGPLVGASSRLNSDFYGFLPAA